MINYTANIEFLAKRKGMTIEKMLENAEINSSSYYRMKRNNKFTTETLEIIAHTLGVEVSDLVKAENNTSIEIKEDFNKINEEFEKLKDELERFEEKHIK